MTRDFLRPRLYPNFEPVYCIRIYMYIYIHHILYIYIHVFVIITWMEKNSEARWRPFHIDFIKLRFVAIGEESHMSPHFFCWERDGNERRIDEDSSFLLESTTVQG